MTCHSQVPCTVLHGMFILFIDIPLSAFFLIWFVSWNPPFSSARRYFVLRFVNSIRHRS
jgi:hypothetical protein